MIIESSNMSLSSNRVYEESDKTKEDIKEWGIRPGETNGKSGHGKGEQSNQTVIPIHDKVSLSPEAKFKSRLYKINGKKTEEISVDPEEGDALDPRYSKLKQLVEAITGKSIKIIKFNPEAENVQVKNDPVDEETQDAAGEQGWGIEYTYSSSHYESEQVSFSAGGSVSTADGRMIDFSIELMMSREYFTEEKLQISAGEPLIDPLTINWSNSFAGLSDMKFSFDLNADGQDESISNLAPGSGFIAFDKNGDGKVNDGTELFGPTTGDGFKELSAYDDDGNNWIDENDTIFTKLSLWRKEGLNDSLISLKDAGVGAIHLGNVRTDFDLTDKSGGDLYGKVQSSGVYLKENGSPGLVQQLEIAV